jgi:ornithine decarboxylase
MAPSAITAIELNPSLTSIHSISKISYLDHNGANTPKGLIGNALKKRVESIDHEACEPGDEDSFFVADLGEVYRQHMRWKLNLPRVKPFYGMFTNLASSLLRYSRHTSGQMQPRPSGHPSPC